MTSTQEITPFTEIGFKTLTELAYRECGIVITKEKSAMVQSRLRSRAKKFGFSHFDEYQCYVCSVNGANERKHMISALTTNVSHFFREPHHFEQMIQYIDTKVCEVLEKKSKIRIWSAGCSNGQEAYSIAMSILTKNQKLSQCDVKILATDIDRAVVKFAQDAKYRDQMISGIGDDLKSKYFSRSGSQGIEEWTVRSEVKSLVTFRELNLLGEWPMRGPFDAIFCRNVVIYFDNSTQEKLWPRFRSMLKTGSLLFLGHSERINEPERYGFEPFGQTSYRASS